MLPAETAVARTIPGPAALWRAGRTPQRGLGSMGSNPSPTVSYGKGEPSQRQNHVGTRTHTDSGLGGERSLIGAAEKKGSY